MRELFFNLKDKKGCLEVRGSLFWFKYPESYDKPSMYPFTISICLAWGSLGSPGILMI